MQPSERVEPVNQQSPVPTMRNKRQNEVFIPSEQC
jgi:hypothetical protein